MNVKTIGGTVKRNADGNANVKKTRIWKRIVKRHVMYAPPTQQPLQLLLHQQLPLQQHPNPLQVSKNSKGSKFPILKNFNETHKIINTKGIYDCLIML